MNRIALLLLALAASATLVVAEENQFPGQKADGFLLPNGAKLTPAGDQVPLKDLPLNVVPLSDGKHALVATSGYNAHELSLVDLDSSEVVQSEAVKQSWFGLALSANE